MKQHKDNRIDIILTWRIGDTLLCIPMLVCLKQLNEKYNAGYNIQLLAQSALQELFNSLGIFPCKSMGYKSKIASYLKPADKAFFTQTTTKNLGYHAKQTYGLTNPFKKQIFYKHELPFLDINKTKELLPEKLVSFLFNDCKLPFYSISLFGICLELGFTVEQIIDTYDMNADSLHIQNFSKPAFDFIDDNYIIFCMEAAYGKQGDAYRCWNEDNYVKIADRCFDEFNIKSVFIGIDDSYKLPEKSHLIDLRKQLNLFQLAQVMKYSVCYIGNDTGPLHIANIMQKKTIGIYFREISLTEFRPIFPELNTQIFSPENIEAPYTALKSLIQDNIQAQIVKVP